MKPSRSIVKKSLNLVRSFHQLIQKESLSSQKSLVSRKNSSAISHRTINNSSLLKRNSAMSQPIDDSANSLNTGLSVRNIHTLKSAVLLADEERKYSELSKFLPPVDHPEYNVRRSWIIHLITHKFTVSADFVAQLGHAVHLVDVRLEHELTGPVGYIPGVNWFPRTDVQKIIDSFPEDGLIACVCINDADSREVVKALKAAGRPFAAILAGGMRTWKLMGFSTSRDPSILNRRCVPVSKVASVPCPTNRAGKRQMTLHQISEHIGTGEGIQWIKMAAFMVHGRLSCVDGRDDCGVIGTPGGDMGEFIIALAVAEELLNRHLSDADVAVLFQRRLDAFGRFYMHTDQTCLDKLMAAIYNDSYLKTRFKPVTSHFAMNALLHSVPPDCREHVLVHLINPDHIGCGHLRFLMTQCEKYKVRRGLAITALRCFFYSGWDGATECDFVVLAGQHEECGVANVSLTNDVHSFTRIPLIPPAIQGNQVFVNHEQISAYLRKQLAEWFLSQDDILPLSKTAAAAFRPMMDLLADLHANNTLGALATDLPMYTLKFDDTGFCEVHYNGIIGSANESVESNTTTPAESHTHSANCSHGQVATGNGYTHNSGMSHQSSPPSPNHAARLSIASIASPSSGHTDDFISLPITAPHTHSHTPMNAVPLADMSGFYPVSNSGNSGAPHQQYSSSTQQSTYAPQPTTFINDDVNVGIGSLNITGTILAANNTPSYDNVSSSVVVPTSLASSYSSVVTHRYDPSANPQRYTDPLNAHPLALYYSHRLHHNRQKHAHLCNPETCTTVGHAHHPINQQHLKK